MPDETRFVIAECHGGQWGAALYVVQEEEFSSVPSNMSNSEADARAYAETVSDDTGARFVEEAPKTK